jgi:hypothetical protein
MAGVRVLHWNGKDIPEELRGLPVGRYVVEPVDHVAPALSPEDEEGLRLALASLRGENGRTIDQERSSRFVRPS